MSRRPYRQATADGDDMISAFTFQGSSSHIVFGVGASASVADWVERLDVSKALVLTTPGKASDGESIADALARRCTGVFSEAAMHTPSDVTERAVSEVQALNADCLVAFGGGSTTGLAKAIAYRTDLPQIIIPTTYAGSEVTPVLGQTEAGKKTTLRDLRVLPEVVIYDPQLTVGLPVKMSVNSGLNAMAHAAEALYAQDRNPIATLMAVEALSVMRSALPAIFGNPKSLAARTECLYGAWLCGSVLGSVGVALHHKLCHTLGGSFNTPHAETHAVILPHAIGFNAEATTDLLQPISDIFGDTPGKALYDFARSLNAPRALSELGLSEADLDRAAEIATSNPYPNPRPIDKAAIRELLQRAWVGERPPH